MSLTRGFSEGLKIKQKGMGVEMRVTTGMLNRNRGGVTGSRKSLLSHIQRNREGGIAGLKALGAVRSESALRRTEKAGYEKLGNAADSLVSQADRLAEKVDKGSAEIDSLAEGMVEAYNSTVGALGDAEGVLNNYYHRTMKQSFSDNCVELGEIGISMNSRGKLVLDKEKLKAADAEKVKKLLGSEGDFLKRVSLVASRVSDNAAANRQSLSNSYNARGNIMNSYLSKYNKKG